MKLQQIPSEGECYFRPVLDEIPQNLESGDHVAHRLMSFIKELWAEDPKIRPGCQVALSSIIKISPFK